MPVLTEKDLTSQARSLWLKAYSAIELKNFDYAISLLTSVLKESPNFLDGRRLLRRAQLDKNKGKKNRFGSLSGTSLSTMKMQGQVKKDPLGVMDAVEKLLAVDPVNVQANLLLRDAALAAGFVEVAGFALETLRDATPKDVKILHELGRYYYDNGHPTKAVEIYGQITDINPADMEAVKAGKDAAARASMSTGGWEAVAESGGEKNYRDLIVDKDQAISLEQQNRVVKGDEIIESQLAELWVKHQESPQNVDVARKTAGLYEQKGDLENAINWYAYTRDLSQGTDPVVVRKIADLETRQLEAKISERVEWLKEAGEDHPEAPRIQEEIASLKVQKAGALLDDARRRVERNPTDLLLRLELGEQLIAAGYPTEAIPELQQARRNPSVRYKAMALLGECYVAKNMIDFAVKQLEEAMGELRVMDDTKKSIVYQLGQVYDKMGRTADSINCMKQIYEIDYGYRDVARRVEESYSTT